MSVCTIDLGSRRNLYSEVPRVRSINKDAYKNLGPIEREEVLRADKIDYMCEERQRKERRNFKGY